MCTDACEHYEKSGWLGQPDGSVDKELAAKPDDLEFNPRPTSCKERTDSCRLVSDPHMSSVALLLFISNK